MILPIKISFLWFQRLRQFTKSLSLGISLFSIIVYKLKKIVGSNNLSAQFIKIGYNIKVLQQTACFVVNPITIGNFSFLFNCTPVDQTSDSMVVPT